MGFSELSKRIIGMSFYVSLIKSGATRSFFDSFVHFVSFVVKKLLAADCLSNRMSATNLMNSQRERPARVRICGALVHYPSVGMLSGDLRRYEPRMVTRVKRRERRRAACTR